MRIFLCICFVALVAELSPAIAQDATPSDGVSRAAELARSQPGVWLPADRVGRVSLVSGNVDLRRSEEAGWADAELNQPLFPGESLRTGPQARSGLGVGGITIGLQGGTEIGLAELRDDFTRITVARGRVELHLRQFGSGETVEIDFPQGRAWLTGRGIYDIDAGDGDRPARMAVFEGRAHVVGAGGEIHIEPGQSGVMAASAQAPAIEPALPDEFVEWCREQDYDEAGLAAPYYVSARMTGFADLDTAGVWKIDANHGPVWFPADFEWAPYRFGHWSWIAPWGWTWIDDRPWGFAPSHFGRWVLINEHWAWAPGNFVERPYYAPAVVAFLGTPGVGLSSEEGAAAAWFPLGPGEAYWPIYSRDVDYVRKLNLGSIEDLQSISMQGDSDPPLEFFFREFANREFATVVPRSVFINGRPVAPARISIPEHRLQNAPVLMASPQIAPPSAQRIARAVTKPVNAPPDRVIIRLARKGKTKLVRSASAQPQNRAQPVVIRGVHLHTPSYGGQTRGRQAVVLRAAYHIRGGGKGAR